MGKIFIVVDLDLVGEVERELEFKGLVVKGNSIDFCFVKVGNLEGSLINLGVLGKDCNFLKLNAREGF